RGNASGSGNYSGRGMKGQRSRSGGKGGLKLRGLKQSMMAVPKKRGFSSIQDAVQIVKVSQLDKHFADGDTVDAAALAAKNLVGDKYAKVKVLADGTLKKKLIVKLQAASKSAQEKIEKAGGSFEAIAVSLKPKKEKPAANKPAEKKPAAPANQTEDKK
ncbi:50S ribosomal protein L15, partial [Patescibacteria group bacterium]